MARYILGRLLGLVFVLFAVSLITFLMTRAVPGDPFASGERELPEATQIARAEKYGFDQPILVQYGRYVWSVLHGDFGIPFQSPSQTVVELIKQTWPVTLKIGALTILVSYPLGILLGLIAALHRNSWIDYIVTFGSTLGMVVPNFVVAVWLILLFSVGLGWLPTGGWGSPAHLVLPVIAYSLLPTALVARYTRVSLLESLGADHVRTARAKGLVERAVVVRHALRNALIPVITVLGLDFGYYLTGSILTETIFSWPGLGRYVVNAISRRDLPAIQGSVLFLSVVFVAVNLITDLAYAKADPRVAYE